MVDEVPTPPLASIPDVVESLERDILRIDEIAGAEPEGTARDGSASGSGAEEPPD